MRGRSLRLTTTAMLLGAIACGGRLLPVTGEGEQQDGGSSDAAEDGDGSSGSDAGPPPVPVCAGDIAMCLPPDAGVNWTGAAVVYCQPQQYPASMTLILERLMGTTWHFVQQMVVPPDWGGGVTFDDTTGPQTVLTYRVCVQDVNTSLRCSHAFTTQGPPNCGCEPTSCWLQGACYTQISDECGHTLDCGACENGMPCNSDHTCCAMGFMPDLWGGCVCAPPPNGCGRGEWQTTDCECHYGQ